MDTPTQMLRPAAESWSITVAQLMQSNVLFCSHHWFSCANPLMCLHVRADAMRASDWSPFYPANFFPGIPCR